MPAACAAQNADDLEPVQEWTLPERAGNDGNLQYPTNFARFQNVQTLVMYFPTNHGADVRCRNPLRGPSCGWAALSGSALEGRKGRVWEGRTLRVDSSV